MAEPIYLESGTKWSFAGAVEWPGWCRHARGEADPVAELVACGERYGDALAPGGLVFKPPSDLEVVERLEGNKGTECGHCARAHAAAGATSRNSSTIASRVIACI